MLQLIKDILIYIYNLFLNIKEKLSVFLSEILVFIKGICKKLFKRVQKEGFQKIVYSFFDECLDNLVLVMDLFKRFYNIVKPVVLNSVNEFFLVFQFISNIFLDVSSLRYILKLFLFLGVFFKTCLHFSSYLNISPFFTSFLKDYVLLFDYSLFSVYSGLTLGFLSFKEFITEMQDNHLNAPVLREKVSSLEEDLLKMQNLNTELREKVKFLEGRLSVEGIYPNSLTDDDKLLLQKLIKANSSNNSWNVPQTTTSVLSLLSLCLSIIDKFNGIFYSGTPEISKIIPTVKAIFSILQSMQKDRNIETTRARSEGEQPQINERVYGLEDLGS